MRNEVEKKKLLKRGRESALFVKTPFSALVNNATTDQEENKDVE